MRIVHVISNLGIGGAELCLCSLIEQTAAKGMDHLVVSLLAGGVLRPRLEEAGARVIELQGRRGLAGALQLRALGSHLADARPNVVHAWMYHSNIAASVVRALGYFRCPLIWSIRQGLDNLTFAGGLTGALIRIGARLSGGTDVVVYNSEHAATTHEAIGYAKARRAIIHNGVDCDRFRPRPDARAVLRAELGLTDDVALIGRIARYSPMKDFATLIGAFRRVVDAQPSARLLLVGTDIDPDNEELVALCRSHDCLDRVILIGPRLDVEQVYPALDLHVSSSSVNEGFPNVVAEALATGTLVASTAVGETSLVNNGAHRVVPPGNQYALGAAMLELLALDPEQRGKLSEQGRSFVMANFSIAAFAQRHIELYERLLRGG